MSLLSDAIFCNQSLKEKVVYKYLLVFNTYDKIVSDYANQPNCQILCSAMNIYRHNSMK